MDASEGSGVWCEGCFLTGFVTPRRDPGNRETAKGPLPGMNNKLLALYEQEAASFRWLASLDAEALRVLLVSTWQITLWHPADVDKSLLKFYGHVIDGPQVMRFMQTLRLRLAYCDKYAWAVPDADAIAALVKHSPLIEIGAGRGYWAGLASAAGADIIAFDPQPPVAGAANSWHRTPGTFFKVAAADLDVVALHPQRTLFLCWPPWNSDVALRTLRHYTGATVIYVGDEGHNAGSPEFYAELKAGFSLQQVVNIPRWPGATDRLEVWQRSQVTTHRN